MPPNLITDDQTAKKLVAGNQGCKSHNLNQDQLNDLELLLYGNYQPLNGYLCEKDYLSVLENFCLEDGSPWSKLLSLQVNKKLYEEMLEAGIAKECARFVLPLATPTRIYMTGSCRSWIHYINLRTGHGTQKEHMNIAKECKNIFSQVYPVVASALNWQN